MYSALYPCMRRQRINTSCSVLLSAWPMCRAPVTFGGGMTMQNCFRAKSGRLWKKPRSSQNCSQRCCASLGSYALGSSVAIRCNSFSSTNNTNKLESELVLIRVIRGSLLLVLQQLVLKGVRQRQPACFDDVFTDANRAPYSIGVAPFDHHADACGRLGAGVDDAHLVILQVHLGQARIRGKERFAKRAIQRVHRAIA